MKKKDIIKLWKIFSIDYKIVELILLKTTDLSKNQLFLIDEIDDKYIPIIKEYFQKLKKGTQIEYLLENVNFYSLDFFVNNNVLIPRDDTEIMVSKVLESIKKLTSKYSLIDVWTWSWCIIISIMKNVNILPIKSYALDISDLALEITKINIQKHNIEDRVSFKNSDLLWYFLNEKQDFTLESSLIITANLPYIKDDDFGNMDTETIEYEPDLALYWWEKTGFEMYEKLFIQIFELKKIYKIKEIIVFIEIWFDQKNISTKFFKDKLLDFEYYKDNSWIERCIKITV